MPRRDRTTERLDELAALKTVAEPAMLLDRARQAIDDRTNLVVARAVKIAVARQLRGVEDLLAPAFDRFMTNAEKADPGCAAKTAIVEAII